MDVNGKKISAKILQSKTIKEYLQFSGATLSAVLDVRTLADKISLVLANPDFIAADDQIGWLINQVQAIVISHVSSNSKNPLLKVQIGFDLAALADMTVEDVVTTQALKEANDA